MVVNLGQVKPAWNVGELVRARDESGCGLGIAMQRFS